MTISREKLLSTKLKTDKVSLNGEDLYVRELTGEEAMQYATRQKNDNKPIGYMISVAAQDENGAAMFTEDDIDALAGLPYSAAEPIASKIIELSGMKPKDDAEKKQNGSDSETTPAAG